MGKAIGNIRAERAMRMFGTLLMNVSLDGISDDVVEKILQNPRDFSGRFREFLEREQCSIGAAFLTATYKETVNYNLSVEELLKAGKYEVNRDITNKNFPSSEKGEKEVEFGMFHFKRDMSSDNVIAEMKSAGYRPATMKETLSFGKNNPELQREYTIIALGSVAELYGRRLVGGICCGRYVDSTNFVCDRDAERYVFLVDVNHLNSLNRFLVVRE